MQELKLFSAAFENADDHSAEKALAVPSTSKEYHTGTLIDFIARYGHDGGWDPALHSSFLKIRQKHSNEENFLQLCSNALFIDVDEIQKHDLWYREYLRHVSENKLEIQRWKKGKIQNGSTNVVAPSSEALPKPFSARSKLSDAERSRIKEQIREYKVVLLLI